MHVALGWRGLLWVASLVGLGSWLGGDEIENQTVIQSKWTAFDYLVAILLIVCGTFLLLWILKRLKVFK